jgi:Tfp pilus assembly protein PilE
MPLGRLAQIKMIFWKTKRNTGFMVVEVLVSISIVAVLVITTTSIIQKSLEISRRTLYSAQANFLTEASAEIFLSGKNLDWNYIETFGNDTLYMLHTEAMAGQYVRYLFTYRTVDDPDPFCQDCYLVDDTFAQRVKLERVYRGGNGDICDPPSSPCDSHGVDDPKTRLVTVYTYWKDKESIESGNYKTKSMSFYISDLRLID